MINYLEVEKAVLCAIIIDSQLFYRCPEIPPHAWSIRTHRMVYEQMGSWAGSKEASVTSLIGRLTAVDPETNWSSALAEVSSASSGSYHGLEADLVENARLLVAAAGGRAARKLMVEANAAIDRGDHEDGASLLADAAEALISSNPRAKAVNVTVEDVVSSISERIQAGKGKVGPNCGFPSLDDGYGGLTFAPGKLVIVAARPGMGKTALALSWMRAFSEQTAGGMWSCEMDPDESVARLIGAEARLSQMKITSGKLDSTDLRYFREAAGIVSEMPVMFSESAAANVMTIARLIRDVRAKYGGCSYVIVDYLQRMKPLGKYRNKHEAVGEISAGLKHLARTEGVNIIAPTQLNRAVEGREGRRITLSDLRDSGDIEQDADVIFALDRPILYNPAAPRDLATLDVLKYRNGPAPNRIELSFDGTSQRFVEV